MNKQAEQFYCNYEFSDQKVNDCGDLNEERLTELMEAYLQSRVNAISVKIDLLERIIISMDKANETGQSHSFMNKALSLKTIAKEIVLEKKQLLKQ